MKTIQCPRCLGKTYMDEADIRRFNRQNEWLPGPCTYCNETGVINDVNFSYQAENQSVKKSLPSISKPVKYTAGSLASIGILLSWYNRCTEDHKTPEKVTVESRYPNLPDMDLKSTLKPDYSGLEGRKPSFNMPPLPEKVNHGTQYNGSNFMFQPPSDEDIVKMLYLLEKSGPIEKQNPHVIENEPFSTRHHRVIVNEPFPTMHHPVIENEPISRVKKSNGPQLEDSRITDTPKGIKIINARDTTHNH